jgi:hypothetical protein
MSTQPSDEIVRLATARNPFEAHEWEQALRDEEIYCKVVGDYLNAGLGGISGILPEIWVRKEDLERAEKVLSKLEDTVAESGEEE